MLKENYNVLLEYDHIFNFPPIDGEYEKFIKARVIHTPSDVGDFWIFESLDTGLRFYQNPMDSNFVRIYMLEDNYATTERQVSEDNF
jgi:hypothetical protein